MGQQLEEKADGFDDYLEDRDEEGHLKHPIANLVTCVITIAVIVLVVRHFRAPADLVRRYVVAALQFDGEAMVDLMPRQLVEMDARKQGIPEEQARAALVRVAEEGFSEYREYEPVFGSMRGIRVKVKKKTVLRGDELEEDNRLLAEAGADLKLQEERIVTVTVSGKIQGERVRFQVEDFLLCRCDGKWAVMQPLNAAYGVYIPLMGELVRISLT